MPRVRVLGAIVLAMATIGLVATPSSAGSKGDSHKSQIARDIAELRQARNQAMKDLRVQKHEAQDEFKSARDLAEEAFEMEMEALEAEQEALEAECDEAEGADAESCEARVAELEARQEAAEEAFEQDMEDARQAWRDARMSIREQRIEVKKTFKTGIKELSRARKANRGKR